MCATILVDMNGFTSFATSFFSPDMVLFLIIFLFFILGFFILVAVIVRLSAQMKYITYPVYDQVIKEAQSKAVKIIDSATEQAQSIRTSAQETAERMLSDRKEEDGKLRDEYVKNFENITTHGKESLKKQSEELLRLSQEMVNKFEEQVLSAEALIHKDSDIISNTLLEESEKIKKTLEETNTQIINDQMVLVAETKKSVSEGIEKDISMAREVISAYKKERISGLDSEIVALVEETARIALNRTLSLKEHRDQVFSALKEAKEDGIFT